MNHESDVVVEFESCYALMTNPDPFEDRLVQIAPNHVVASLVSLADDCHPPARGLNDVLDTFVVVIQSAEAFYAVREFSLEGMLDSFTQRKNVTVNLNTPRRA